MTVKINHFAVAIRANAESVQVKNKSKADKLVMLTNDKACNALLNAAQIDATLFATRALYATEKAVKIVYSATREVADMSEVNDNAFATIKTLLNAFDAKVNVTKRDIEAALSNDVKIDATRAHVYRRKATLSVQTLAAQSQQCADFIKTLRLVKEVATNVYEVQDTLILQQMRKTFADCTL